MLEMLFTDIIIAAALTAVEVELSVVVTTPEKGLALLYELMAQLRSDSAIICKI